MSQARAGFGKAVVDLGGNGRVHRANDQITLQFAVASAFLNSRWSCRKRLGPLAGSATSLLVARGRASQCRSRDAQETAWNEFRSVRVISVCVSDRDCLLVGSWRVLQDFRVVTEQNHVRRFTSMILATAAAVVATIGFARREEL